MTYLEYAYLQMGESDKAREQINRIRTLMTGSNGNAWAEVDARILYDVQTSDWGDALKITAPASSPSKENFDVFWVHAVAAAHLGDVTAARQSLRDLTDSIAHQKSDNWANALHVYLLQAQSAVATAEGRSDDAIATLKSGLLFEQTHAMDYPNILSPPSAEPLGMLFLSLHRPKEASEAFREALSLAPKTINSVRGVEKAAETGRLGDPKK